MIEVSGLTKRFRDRAAVQDLSFSIGRGEVVGLLGPNGAGKTTTLRLVTGYLPATAGTVRVAGFDVFERPGEARRRWSPGTRWWAPGRRREEPVRQGEGRKREEARKGKRGRRG